MPMKSRSISATATDRLRGPLAVVALATFGAVAGCVPEDAVDEQDELARVDEPLIRGTGPQGLGYSCKNGVCECDKSIENDCEDMSAECTEESLDSLITCIDGWLTTHCDCTQAFVAPKPKFPVVAPIGGTIGM
jgi:hypothetical protein